MGLKRKSALGGLLLGAGIAWHGCALALPDGGAPEGWASGWTPVSAERLDGLRAGFDAGTGLLVSFGIERVVSVNGNVVSNTSFNIADVAKLNPEQAKLAAAALSTVTLVQVGPGNSAQPLISGALGPGLIIQNTQNDQVIRSQTVINTSVNTLSLLKSINLEGVLRDALAGAVSPK
jgi:hypothetical protein